MFESLETPLAQLSGDEWPGADLFHVAQTLLESWEQGREEKVEKGRGGAASALISKTELMLAELGHKAETWTLESL